MSEDLTEILEFASSTDWEAWLHANHDSSSGAWLRFAKKGAGLQTVSRPDALDIAICFGWIDGKSKSESGSSWVQRFTPRGKRSIWSRINRDKAIALTEAGRMKPAGLLEVERAQGDGRWDAAYEPPATSTVPHDLAAALADNPRAREFFDGLDSQNRYSVLFRIHQAKRPETRARRIGQFVEMLARGEKLHH